MRKAVLIATLLILSAFTLSAQSLTSLCVPDDPDAVVLGSMSRDRFGSNRTMLSGSLWSPLTLKARDFALSQTLNFGKWSFEAAGKAYLNRSYNITAADGHITGSYTPYDICASLGASRKLKGGLSAGLTAKFCYSTLSARYRAAVFACDIHVDYVFDKEGMVSLSLCNLGTPVNYGRSDNSLPLMLRAGGFWAPEKWILLSGELSPVFPGGSFMGTGGVRFIPCRFAFVQCGYHFASKEAPVPSYAAAGLGFRAAGLELSASCIFSSGEIGYTPTVSLSYNF